MARCWEKENDEDLLDDAMRVLLATYVLDQMTERIRKAALCILRRKTPCELASAASPAAMCGAEVYDFRGEDDPDGLPHDSRISDQQIERSDRGGE